MAIKIPKTIMMSTGRIIVDKTNPNEMITAKFEALKKNIKKYGFLIPVITNSEYKIADGYHRWKAARELGLTEIPVIALDIKEVDRRILRQVLNKLRGDHDLDKDLEEYQFILEQNQMDELKDLLPGEDFEAMLEERKGVQEDDFDVKESLEKPKYEVKENQIWKLGDHKLICGDSTKEEIFEKLMGKEKATLCFTSAPYNMAGEMYADYKDNLKSEEFIKFNLTVAKNVKDHLRGFMFWNVSYNRNARWEFLKILHDLIMKTGLKFLELIIWDKGHGLPIVSKGMLTRSYEDILLTATDEELFQDLDMYYVGNTEKKAWFNKKTQKGITNYWKIDTNRSQIANLRACFPVGLPGKGIVLMSNTDDIVIDPFGGSGTTLIACEQLDRKCRMVELDPKYCSVIIERWEKFTNKKAEVQKA